MGAPIRPPEDALSPFVPGDREPFDHARLCHLLRRAAIAVSPQRLEAFAGLGPGEAVDRLMGYDPADDRPYEGLLTGLSGSLSPIYSADQAQQWWLMRMLDTPRPLQERVALFWHNHFATSTGKVRQSALVSRQIDLFRRQGLGNFRELVLGVTKDPAMLLWLDGSKNKRGRPNENYAREVMELFTLGIGHYTERDVQELARAFTGYQVLDETVAFYPAAFDDGEKTVLGKTGKLDAESAVDLLLSQAAAPKFIAWKLLREFVHPVPEQGQVDHYAARLVHYGWEIKPVLREILTSRLFFSDWARGSKIKSPCELVVGSMLALECRKDASFAQQSMVRMGQALLAPPSVKGWDGEEIWINANTLLQRYNFGLDLLNRQDAERMVALYERRELRTPERIVDHLVGVLLDGVIGKYARARLVDYMGQDEGGKYKAFKLNGEMYANRVRGAAHLMMCTPQYQVA
jgi:hypothetical protein